MYVISTRDSILVSHLNLGMVPSHPKPGQAMQHFERHAQVQVFWAATARVGPAYAEVVATLFIDLNVVIV
jgi:hypothetical protein